MKRIQRKRTKGWRMPENCVYVGRNTQWGNPFVGDARYYNGIGQLMPHEVLDYFRAWAAGQLANDPSWLDELRGKDLACWCKEGADCHADVLLKMANACAECHGEEWVPVMWTPRHGTLERCKACERREPATVGEGI